MKRTILFLSGMLLLLLGYLVTSYQIHQNFVIPSKKLSGERSAMEDMEFTSSFLAGDTVTELSYDQNGIHTTTRARSRGEYPYQYEERENKNDLHGLLEYYRKDDPSSEGKDSYCNGVTKETYEALDYADMGYQFSYQDTDILLPVDLKKQSNKYSFHLHKTICTKEGKEASRENEMMVYDLDESNSDGSWFKENETQDVYARKMKNGRYYFMPATDQSTTGKVSIYALQEKGSQLDIKEAFSLPGERIYESLRIADQRLIVFSHTKDTLFITCYLENGTILKEMSIPFTYEEAMPKISVVMQDDVAICYLKDGFTVIDLNDLTIKAHILHPYGVFYQVAYENDRLYISEKSSNGWRISVYGKKGLLLQEDIVLSSEEESGYKAEILDYGTFEKINTET